MPAPPPMMSGRAAAGRLLGHASPLPNEVPSEGD
jgi:hypothetical protein